MAPFREIGRDPTSRDLVRYLFDTTNIEVSLSSSQINELAGMLARGNNRPGRKLAASWPYWSPPT